ncbi:MAG: hypothetical protein ACJ8CB_24655 [Ktedonobacteraceae bacterium]
MTVTTFSPEHIYVAPATLLPCDLRAHASTASLCYFQVVDHAPHAERLFVRVTALPHRLDEADSPRVFTVCLRTEKLEQALPWDRAMQDRATCDVRELVECHVQQLGGMLPATAPVAAPALTPAKEEDATLAPLPAIFVSCETVAQVAEDERILSSVMPKRHIISWTRRTWLRAALAVVMRQLSHINWRLHDHLYAFLASLESALRSVFVTQHRTRQQLVCASPVFIEDRQVGWRVQVGVPVPAALAA